MNIRIVLMIAVFTAMGLDQVQAETLQQSEANQTSVSKADQLDRFVQNYYKAPHPADISRNMVLMDQSGVANEIYDSAALFMFYSCIFAAANATQKATWQTEIKQLSEPSQSFLNEAMIHRPNEIMATTPISAERNDLDWGGFFATGDLLYVDDIIARLNDLGERNDMQRYVAAESAAWSLVSNAVFHPKVRAQIAALAASKNTLAPVAAELLRKPEGQFQQEMQQVLKAQHQAGIW